MVDIDTPVYFEDLTGQRFRVTVSYDSDTDSPRTWSNVSIMHTFDSRWNSPDGKVCDDSRHRQIHPLIPGDYLQGRWVDMRRAARWVHLFGASKGILAIAGLARNYEVGTLSVNDADDLEESEGYVVVTADSWAEGFGTEPFDAARAENAMRAEVEVYNRWACGEFTRVLVEREVAWQALDADGNVVEDRTMTTWEIENAVGGFDDEDAALEAGVDLLPEGSEPEE